MDLMDSSTITSSVETFLAQQDRLDVLVNNAGVSGILNILTNTNVLIRWMRAYRLC